MYDGAVSLEGRLRQRFGEDRKWLSSQAQETNSLTPVEGGVAEKVSLPSGLGNCLEPSTTRRDLCRNLPGARNPSLISLRIIIGIARTPGGKPCTSVQAPRARRPSSSRWSAAADTVGEHTRRLNAVSEWGLKGYLARKETPTP